MHLSEKAQRWTPRGRENQRGCASGGCVCNCSISITFDIIIPGLKKKKGGGRFQSRALDQSSQASQAAAQGCASQTSSQGVASQANRTLRCPCCVSKGGQQRRAPGSFIGLERERKLSGDQASWAQVSKRGSGHRQFLVPLPPTHPPVAYATALTAGSLRVMTLR